MSAAAGRSTSNTITPFRPTPLLLREKGTRRSCESKGSKRGIASAIDCNPRYCYLDPYLGAMHAVAESSRNVSCSGATPRGATNCLNFGNPQRPLATTSSTGRFPGLADACRALDVPMVGGNVSLYNETASAADQAESNRWRGWRVRRCPARHATMKWNVRASRSTSSATAHRHSVEASISARVFGEVIGTPPSSISQPRSQFKLRFAGLFAEGLTTTAHDLALGGHGGRARQDGGGIGCRSNG